MLHLLSEFLTWKLVVLDLEQLERWPVGSDGVAAEYNARRAQRVV